MATITIPSVTNPGVSFTRNSCVILRNVCKHFSDTTRHLVPYKELQESYQEVDPKGDSKIRMLFPLYRKAGCIYPDVNGSVRFENGSFLTQLGESFYKISCVYYDTLEKVKELKKRNQQNQQDIAVIINRARELYFGISKTLFWNLCESEDIYRHLFSFIRDFAPVSRDEVSILLYSLEMTSSERGSVVRCDYNKSDVEKLIQDFRAGNLKLRHENANNAVQYFIAVLKTLLIVDASGSNYVLTTEGKSL